MSIAFEAVRTTDDRQRLAALADEICTSTGPPSSATRRPTTWWRTSKAWKPSRRDMREYAYEYWFMRAEDDGRIAVQWAGAWSLRRTASSSRRLSRRRGARQGIASRAIAFYERLCLERGLDAIKSHGEQAERPGHPGLSRQGLPKPSTRWKPISATASSWTTSSWRSTSSASERRAERAGSRTRAAPADTSVLPPPRFRAHPDLPLSASVREPAAPHPLQPTLRSRPRIWHEFTVRATNPAILPERMASATA